MLRISVFALSAHGNVPCLVGCQGPGQDTFDLGVIMKTERFESINVFIIAGTRR